MMADIEKRSTKRLDKPAWLLVIMFFCLLLVHVWILWESREDTDGFFRNWRLVSEVLGNWWAGYRLLNIALLYGCMAAVFFFVRHALRGPWWLCSLVSLMFMAHPLKGEALLETAGSRYLAPALLAFTVLALYAANSNRPRRWKYITALLLAFSAMSFRENWFLPIVLLLFESVALPARLRNPLRSLPFLLLLIYPVILLHWGTDTLASFSPAGCWLPLCFVAWPVPLDWNAAHDFQVDAVLAIGIAGILVLLLLLFLAIRHGGVEEHRIFAFGILAALAIRLGQADADVLPANFNGGGLMMAPIVFLLLSFAALYMRMMRYPALRTRVVPGAILLCAVFFALQINYWANSKLYCSFWRIIDIFYF